jgi:hypothetical protein
MVADKPWKNFEEKDFKKDAAFCEGRELFWHWALEPAKPSADEMAFVW